MIKPRVLSLKMPTNRRYLFSKPDSWTCDALKALVQIKSPENDAVTWECEEPKKEVAKLHNLAERYKFKVCVRSVDGCVLVWVKAPGLPDEIKDLVKLWGK